MCTNRKSLGRAGVRVRAIVLVRDRKGVGGTATARLGALIEVLKSGRRRENVRLGRDGSGLCKQQFGEVSQAMVIREALGGAQAHPNRA